MAKSKVYTRSGDKGQTSLVNGTRILKSDARIELYGEVDELNSWLGVVLSHSQNYKGIEKEKELLFDIQKALFDLGSRLACEEEFWEKFKLPEIDGKLISSMENIIDEMDALLEPLKTFILPGGSKAASFTHVVRTRCRKIERLLVGFENAGHRLPDNTLGLINRLSDFLFVFARRMNQLENIDEPKWEPQKS